MVIESERGKLIFRKMQRDLLRLARDPRPETVHNFRTTSRRLETLLEQLLPACDRNQKKLLKLLSRIRKRAGKIRDLDVQLAALRSFKVPQEPRRKTQLAQRLIELRAEHEEKLHKLMKKRHISEIKKRIKRGLQNVVLSSSRDPLAVARQILSSAAAAGPLTDDVLHRYRIAVKRARYAAEFARESREAAQFIAGLKQLQDALGNWHDWMTLTRTAADHLGEVSQSSLVAALHNVTRLKFRHAVAAVSAWRNDAGEPVPMGRKPKSTRPSAASPAQAA